MAIKSGVTYSPRLDLGRAMREYIMMDGDLIGLQVMRPLRTSKRKASFPVIKRESLLQNPDVKRASGSGYSRGDFETEDQSYNCKERGHEQKLPHDQVAFYETEFDAEMVASQLAMDIVMRSQEIDIAAAIFNTNTWTGADLTTTVDTDWSDKSADIIGDVADAKEKVRRLTGMDPNTVIIGAATLPDLRKNTGIQNAMGDDTPKTDDAVKAALPGIFGVDRVLVGKGVYNSAAEGGDASVTDVWGNGYCMVCITANEGTEQNPLVPCIGRAPLWISDSPDAVMVEEYEEPQTRSTILRSRNHFDEIVIDSSYGHLLDIRP